MYAINQHTPLFVMIFHWFDWLMAASIHFARGAENRQIFFFFFLNHEPGMKHEWVIFYLAWAKAGKQEKKGEPCFKQSQGLMNGDSNPKRDISEIILPPLFPVTVLLDEARLWHAQRREVISLTERLWFFTLMREKSSRRWNENRPNERSSSSSP